MVTCGAPQATPTPAVSPAPTPTSAPGPITVPKAVAIPVSVVWARQFGTPDEDRAQGVALDSAGNFYIVGETGGSLPGQASAGKSDAFVRKYDPNGKEIWTRQFGTSDVDTAAGVAVDSTGNFYIVGDTLGSLPGQTSAGSYDAFVRKYDPNGKEIWTRQFGTPLPDVDTATGVAVDSTGNVYIAGTVYGSLPRQAALGMWDAFVRKYDPDGKEIWTRQFGSSVTDNARGVALDSAGNIYIAGDTNGTLRGQASAGKTDAILLLAGTSPAPSVPLDPSDTTAPVVTWVGYFGREWETASIAWKTNEPTIGRVEYCIWNGPTPEYEMITDWTEEPDTTGAVTLTELEWWVTYQYRVRVKDAGGNEAVSENKSFYTYIHGFVNP
ncbi:MAG: SBBP repeat-containing protein [Chloroflexota bacterium]